MRILCCRWHGYDSAVVTRQVVTAIWINHGQYYFLQKAFLAEVANRFAHA